MIWCDWIILMRNLWSENEKIKLFAIQCYELLNKICFVNR